MTTTRSLRPLAGAVLACCWLAASPLAGQTEEAAESRPASPGELLVELLDASGMPLADPDPAALELRLGDEPRAIGSLEPLSGPWRVVVYIDQLLGDPVRLRAAAYELAERAAELAALGPVEIVLAGETARTALPPTVEPETISQALTWIRVREVAEDAQRGVRERFLDEHGLRQIVEPEPAELADRVAELAAAVRQAVADEAALLAVARGRLLRWLVENDGPGRELMILVTGGFDPDPLVFYRATLGGTKLAGALSGATAPAVTPTVEELARTLSVYGWLVTPFRPAARVDPLAARTREELAAMESGDVETVSQPGSLDTERTVGYVDPTKLFKRRDRDEEDAEVGGALVTPEAPLDEIARATGGELIADAAGLAALLDRLPQRRLLRFDSFQPAGASPARVVVRPAQGRSDLHVRARQWIGRSTPAAVAAVRAERFFNAELSEGELPITATLRFPDERQVGGLVVQLGAMAEETPADAPLRVSVAVDREDGSIDVRHYQIGGSGGQQPEIGGDGSRSVKLPIFFHPEATVATVVEDLRTGRWGAAFAEESLADIVPTADDTLFLPAPKAVHLMAPRDPMVMGRTTFETVVSQHRVSRVEFFLDGDLVAASNAPPYSATVDLGKLPEAHEIEVVAYGAGGEELDRDRLVVNEGAGSFRVRIVDPRTEPQRRGREPLTGNVEVEVDVKLPRGADLARLEFYWRDRLVGTRYAAPYLHRLRIPADDPKGFLRAVGVLDDGTVSEDVLFVNSPGSSERVEVDLVELYVVVTDRRGRPLRGLGREQFRVVEDGEPQALANFGDAGELPITVGLVIDSSASMFVKLPEVQAAAASYINALTSRKDRAFVVGFGNEPRLARDTTSDMSEAIAGLYRLEPDGQTAIWKAVVYSLVQLQGVAGKKALIVYSDGADEDPDFSHKTALRFAQRVGVPIYFIVANDEIYRTGGKSLNIRSFLGRLENLTRQVGGRVFLTSVEQDLGEIYAQIDEELRSQYLLGYYPTDPEGERWRRVEVDVAVPGARERTISGYFR